MDNIPHLITSYIYNYNIPDYIYNYKELIISLTFGEKYLPHFPFGPYERYSSYSLITSMTSRKYIYYWAGQRYLDT